MISFYLIGSLRNPRVPQVAQALRALDLQVFDDWYSPGPECDDKWQEYETARGRTFQQALAGYHAQHVFAFDKRHLDQADGGILILPAGKSGHLELGYLLGQGKPGFIVLDGKPERFDIMYNFATKILQDLDELLQYLTESFLDEFRRCQARRG